MRKLGSLEPVVYFVNHRDTTRPPGWIMLAPYTSFATPVGWSREGAESLPEVDRLERKLMEQEVAERGADLVNEERTMGPLRDAVRDKLYQRMTSNSTSQYEKDFIAAYLQLREDRRDKYHAKYLEFVTYLHARNFDTPKGRRMDSESVNVDRIG